MTTDAGIAATVVRTTSQAETGGVNVYNFTVALDHTYFVQAGTGLGVDAVWVHNDCSGGGPKLTGFSDAESAMVQNGLEALRGANYDTSVFKEIIPELPAGYQAMTLADGAALGDEALGSQVAVNSALEEEMRHLLQRSADQAFAPGTVQAFEEAANVARQFPKP